MDSSKLKYFFLRYQPILINYIIQDADFDVQLYINKNQVNTTVSYSDRDLIPVLIPYNLECQRLKQIMDEILKFEFVRNHSDNSIEIFASDMTLFVQQFSHIDEIDWDFISCQKNFKISREAVIQHKNKWRWTKISENPKAFGLEKEDLTEIFDLLNWSAVLQSGCFTFSPVEIEHLIEGNKIKFDTVSSSESILWDDDFINKYKGQIDWYRFSQNESVKWSEERIYKFSQLLRFDYLSCNKNVEWSPHILKKFQDKWDWASISCNEAIQWKYAELDSFKEKIVWIPRHHYKDEKHLCFSCNSTFVWDTFFFERLKDQIDPWYVARYGSIKNEVLREFPQYFDKIQVASTHFARLSDWHDSHPIYTSGWQNLEKNDNFRLTSELYFFLWKRSFETKVFDGDAREGFTERKVVRPVFASVNSFEDKMDFTFEEIVARSADLHFMNQQIPRKVWSDIIKPALLANKDYFNLFIGQLSERL